MKRIAVYDTELVITGRELFTKADPRGRIIERFSRGQDSKLGDEEDGRVVVTDTGIFGRQESRGSYCND